MSAAPQLAIPRGLAALTNASSWLNTTPLTAAQLRGKVVVVQFWTYTCINWRRTLPYVRAWADEYAASGLVVVGVHSPEFEFEKDLASVTRATREMDIAFPVALDDEHVIWNAFDNEYWPALYFMDAQGQLRHTQFGEGDYARSEGVIQSLLAEAGAAKVPGGAVKVQGSGAELAADWANLRSPENYLGAERTENFASAFRLDPGQRRVYPPPGDLALNYWGVSGDWTVGRQAVTLNAAPGKLSYRFHARDVHLVMGPTTAGTRARFRVTLDGQPPAAAHGLDVDENGNGTVDTPRMYQLLRQATPIVDRTLQIEFLDPAVQAFSFTFG